MIPSNYFPFDRNAKIELFDFFGGATVLAATTGTAVSVRLPGNFKRGFVTVLGLSIQDDQTSFIDSLFAIRVNGVPDRNYQNIIGQLGLISDPHAIIPIIVRPNDVLDVFVTNNGAFGHFYIARLMGFYDYEEK